MKKISCLSVIDILHELLAHADKKTVCASIDLSYNTIEDALIGSYTEKTELKIRDYFDIHVNSFSHTMSIVEAIELSKNNKVLVSTPDGYQGVRHWVIKKPRDLVEIVTKSGKKLRSSIDHLIETSFGWVLSKDIKISDKVLTTDGFEEITEKNGCGNEVVYDFEVEHENHRYFAGDGISSHNSGKSFIAGNLAKHAQSDGAFIIYLDSENAVDLVYLSKIGVDCSEDRLLYLQVTTFNDVTSVLSDFFTDYHKQYGRDNPDAPEVVIFLDSVDMLLTEAENEKFEKGVQTGDMGQRTKQLKHLLRTIVSRLSRTNCSFVFTHQVYQNQDILNGEGNWIVNNSVKYSASQILLITKLKLKDGTDVTGIRMRVETYKSRFAKLGSKIEIEVPYNKGMNPYSGLLEMMVEKGVIQQGGAWYSFTRADGEVKKFQRKQLDAELVTEILSLPAVLKEESAITDLIDGDSVEVNNEIAELEDYDGAAE